MYGMRLRVDVGIHAQAHRRASCRRRARDGVEALELGRRFDVEAVDAGGQRRLHLGLRSCRRRRTRPWRDRRRRRARARARRRTRCRSRCPAARRGSARRGWSWPSSRSRRDAACRRTRRRSRGTRLRAPRASRRSRACRTFGDGRQRHALGVELAVAIGECAHRRALGGCGARRRGRLRSTGGVTSAAAAVRRPRARRRRCAGRRAQAGSGDAAAGGDTAVP